jgi:hypothetical protein
MATFTDLLGQRLSNRMDSVSQPFSAPMDYLTNRVDESMDYGNVQPKIGPTVAAAQGNQPGNPLNIPNPGAMQNEYAQEAQQLATQQPQPIAPEQVAALKQNEVAAAAPVATTAPVAPKVPEQAYNQFIAGQESGAKPDIGYHYGTEPGRASSAYGTYGITAPAYKDIQQADQYFANRDITSLNKEEQARANLAYRNVLSNQLQQFGVEPTEQNIRGAHLAGAKGLAEYLQKGTVSPAAAAANGGEAKFRQLLQGRLASVPTDETGALPPDQSANFLTKEVQKAHIENFQKNQNDLKVVSNTAFNEDVDPVTRMVANDKLVTALDNQKQIKEKSAIVDSALADPSGQGALKMMNQLSKESDEGSILKAIFYNRVGLKELASQEQKKLGAGDTYQPVLLEGGKQGWVKVNANGAPLQGWTAEGAMSPQQLLNAQLGIKGTTTHTGKMIDSTTGKVYYEQTTPQGIRLIEAGTGQAYKGPSQNLHPYGIGSDLDLQNKKQLQEYRNKLIYEPTISAAKAYFEMASKVDPGDGSEIGKARQLFQRLNINPQEVGVQTQAPTMEQAPAPITQTVPQAAAPQQAAPVAQPTGGAPATVTIPASELVRRQGESFAAYEKRISLLQKAQEVPIAVSETTQKEFVKTADEIRNAGADGSSVKNIRKQQIDILRNNPQIAGILYGQGTQYDNARRFILDSLSGRFSGQEGGVARSEELGRINMNPNEKAALAEFANLTASINQKTLKAASGAGSVSDAEQRSNKEANLQYVERLEPMMVVNELTRSQFTGDLANAKANFLNQGQYKTRQEFDTAWNKEQNKLVQQYEGIYKARLNMLKPFLEAVQQNPSDATALQRRRDAIMHSINVYPAPEYNIQTGKWDYKTENARNAAMRMVIGR